MASVNQDFVTFAGDDVAPIFTVKDTSGVAVDISTVSNITWTAKRSLTTAAVITKTKGSGAITFVTNGTDGKFKVSISSSDTASLSGWYLHTASITDSGTKITTVTIGRMQVGLAPSWSYDASLVGTTDLYTVRRIIGDVLVADQKLADAEIQWTINNYSNVYLAAAECCRNIAAQAVRKVDISVGTMRTNYSQEARNYQALAGELEARGMTRGGVSAYVGGISISDKQTVEGDSDRVSPQFVLGMFDDNLAGQTGHETIDSAWDEGNIA